MTLSPPRTRVRDREDTRQRILDATIALLVDTGYARTSTWAVCERAKVSRGALLHHFPTRVSLFVAAVSHLAQAPLDQLDAALRETPARAQPGFFVDWLWATLDGDLFTVGLELLTAARTEPELHAVVRAGGDELREKLEETIRAIVQANGEALEGKLHTALRMSIVAVRGIGLDLAVGGDVQEHRRIYEMWRVHVANALASS